MVITSPFVSISLQHILLHPSVSHYLISTPEQLEEDYFFKLMPKQFLQNSNNTSCIVNFFLMINVPVSRMTCPLYLTSL